MKLTMEILNREKWRDKGFIHGQMVKHTKANGNKINYMEKVNFIGLMELTFKEIMKMMKEMVKELLFGMLIKDIEELGHVA